ncbi:MAG TPA: MFS transporter [Actinocrinis sp.]|uniref:MFS transporter n=1 Tax=Actinocrinis sp. TaxID=1920516 RepID=UPI002DDCFBA4|nr:MFS transporter [Actinocrinis sp.]HEV2346681.1 MFS transporter [Actinocrinis sp.]
MASIDEKAATRPPLAAAILVTSIPLFMATLDNLVVVFALPVIKVRLGGSAESMQWVVNAYTLAYAGMLLTAAALGDRLGRRRLFALGILVFTAASATSALAPNTAMLITSRVVQGLGAAAIMPLSLTLLASAVKPSLRPLAIGIWGAVNGIGIALGPLVSGAVVNGLSWQWIFWLNVPLGMLVLPFMWRTLRESHGPDKALDPLGLVLVSGGVFAMLWAIIHSDSRGWSSAQTLVPLIGGSALVGVFLAWQARARTPLMPLRLFRNRSFSAINFSTIAFSFGLFGSVFLLSQFFQVVDHYSPLESGVDTMPWTMVPMITAPLSSVLMGKLGPRVIVSSGLALLAGGLAWVALTIGTSVPYSTLVPPFVIAGAGLGMVLAPTAIVVIMGVPDADHGKASGVNNTLREMGTALGIAVLSAVFAAQGSYASGESFVDGLRPALWVGAAVVGFGALWALALPGARTASQHLADEAAALAAEEPVLDSSVR